MLFFLFKVIAGGLIIAFSSWLAGQNPKLAGFIIALPLVSLIAILFSYYEHNDTEKTVMFTKSIFIAVPASYLFFVPFFFAKSFNMNFFIIYIGVVGWTIAGFISKDKAILTNFGLQIPLFVIGISKIVF